MGSHWTCVQQRPQPNDTSWMPQPMQQLPFTFGRQQAGLKWGNRAGRHWLMRLVDFCPCPVFFHTTSISHCRTKHRQSSVCISRNSLFWVTISFKVEKENKSNFLPVSTSGVLPFLGVDGSACSNGMYSRIWMYCTCFPQFCLPEDCGAFWCFEKVDSVSLLQSLAAGNWFRLEIEVRSG